MNKKIAMLMMFGSLFCLTSCEFFNGLFNGGGNFKTTANSELVENEDYIDHSSTSDGSTLSYNNSMWYVNELKKVPLPDPQVYVEDDVYYIVGTSDRDNSVIDCYSTTDFVSFTKHEGIYDPNKYNGWESRLDPIIFAPEMYLFDETYYMYYSAIDKSGVRRNSVVEADNPLGPYRPIQNSKVNGLENPLFLDQNQNFDVLDISVFKDDDGQLYMYYSVSCNENQHIVGVKLNSPYEADWSTYKKVVEPGSLSSSNSVFQPLTWEKLRSGKPIVEAPFMIKSKGKYYLTYSVNGCWNKFYNVCYTVSESPLGDFKKPFTSGHVWTNLLLGYPGTSVETSTVYQQWSGFSSGTAHHCFFNVGDQIMIGYHGHKNRDHNLENNWTQRYFAFDYLYFDKDGVPFCNGPTYSIQPLPEYVSGYKNVASGAKVRFKNVENASAINDNYIVDCYNLPVEDGKEVVLGEGYAYIELEFDKEYEIGGFLVYNSAYYEKKVMELEYVDFGDGNAVKYVQFPEIYVKENKEFIYPASAFSVEFIKTFKSKKVIICVKSDGNLQLNEIVVLGR